MGSDPMSNPGWAGLARLAIPASKLDDDGAGRGREIPGPSTHELPAPLYGIATATGPLDLIPGHVG
jgi:hypothetical protein